MGRAEASRRAAVLLAAVLAAPGLAGQGEPPRSATSAAAGEALERRLQVAWSEVKAGRTPREKSIEVSEGELNSYLCHVVRLPPSLSGVEVRFERDRVSARGLLDLDQIQERLSGVPGSLGLLSGKVAVSARARLESDDGFGRMEVESVQLGAFPIAPAVLAQIVAASTRSPERPSGLDILAPFRYPYSVKRVRLHAGRAFLDF